LTGLLGTLRNLRHFGCGFTANFLIVFVLRFSLSGCPMTFDDLPLTILLLATGYLISVHLLLRFFSRNAGEPRSS